MHVLMHPDNLTMRKLLMKAKESYNKVFMTCTCVIIHVPVCLEFSFADATAKAVVSKYEDTLRLLGKEIEQLKEQVQL